MWHVEKNYKISGLGSFFVTSQKVRVMSKKSLDNMDALYYENNA